MKGIINDYKYNSVILFSKLLNFRLWEVERSIKVPFFVYWTVLIVGTRFF